LGVAASFFISCVFSLLPIPESVMISYMEATAGLTSGSIIIRLLSTIIMAPIVEEIVFRGLVLSRLKKAMKLWVAIIISSLIFGLLHGQLIWIIYAFALGILMAAVAERTKSVGASVVLHVAFNSVSLFSEYIDFSKGQMIVVGIISLIVCAGFLFYIVKKENRQKIHV